MRRKSAGTTWRIEATFREYYGPREDTKERIRTYQFDIAARTLPDAFLVFNKKYQLAGLIGIEITEVKRDGKEKEEGPRTAVS